MDKDEAIKRAMEIREELKEIAEALGGHVGVLIHKAGDNIVFAKKEFDIWWG